VGGSGQAGTPSDQTAEEDVAAPQDIVSGSMVLQGPSAPQATIQDATGGTAAGGTQPSGEAVVNAIYKGTVSSVSGERLVLLDDEGQAFTLELSDRTRVDRKGKRISAQQLKEGTPVRATVDLLSGGSEVVEISVLPEP
jgi:hypothetical protein